MIECNFEYTDTLIKNINLKSTKKYNMMIEIALFVMFVATLVLIITHNKVMAIVCGGMLVALLGVLVITNIILSKNNSILLGQKVNIKFDKELLIIVSKLGNKELYKANVEYDAIKSVEMYKDIIFLYINKESAIIIPKICFKSNKDYNTVMQLVQNNYIV